MLQQIEALGKEVLGEEWPKIRQMYTDEFGPFETMSEAQLKFAYDGLVALKEIGFVYLVSQPNGSQALETVPIGEVVHQTMTSNDPAVYDETLKGLKQIVSNMKEREKNATTKSARSKTKTRTYQRRVGWRPHRTG